MMDHFLSKAVITDGAVFYPLALTFVCLCFLLYLTFIILKIIVVDVTYISEVPGNCPELSCRRPEYQLV